MRQVESLNWYAEDCMTGTICHALYFKICAIFICLSGNFLTLSHKYKCILDYTSLFYLLTLTPVSILVPNCWRLNIT